MTDEPEDSSTIVEASPCPNVPASPRLPVSTLSPSRFSVQVAWTFGARVLMIANSVAAGIIVARVLGATGVGELAVINVSVMTLVQLGSFGLPSANTFFVARDPSRFRTVAMNSLLFALVLGSLLAVALIVAARLRPSWFGSISSDLIRIAAISIPFQLLALIGLNILLAMGKVKEFNLLDLAGQSFVLINSLVALVVFHRGLESLVALNTTASILVSAVIAVVLMFSGKRLMDQRLAWRGDWSLLAQMMRYGFKFHMSILAGALIFRADLLVVNHFRGASEAGVYSVASQMGMMLMLLPGVIATLLFPRITAEQDKRGEVTCQVTRYTAFIMLLCCLAAVPLSFLLPVLYGSGFSDAAVQLLILLVGVYLMGLQSVMVQHFNAMGLPLTIPLFWLITLATNVALVFALVPRFGARGAAVASTISYSIIFVLVAVHFRVKSGRSLSDVFLLRREELRRLLSFGSTAVRFRSFTG
jgi:O-antigen/teichoic acid export membrane protein